MKKIFNFMLFLGLLLFFPVIVRANSIDKIDMDIYIDKSGTAHVTEVWSANLSEGTEGYKPYYNLGEAKITNFKVSENNKTYSFNNSWNTSDSFSNKAYKNGINYVKNGLELCWGISKYGYHNYKLTYDIEGFVVKLTDADMVYWQLIPYELSQKPDNVHIKIYSDNKYSDELPVWGYGKYGATAYVSDGYIEMNSEGTLYSREYMTILVKFNKDTFDTYHTIDKDFNYYLDMANEGATKYDSSVFSSSYGIFDIIKVLFIFLFPILIIVFVVLKAINSAKSGATVGYKTLDFGKNGRVIPKNIPNVRDIPFDKDIYKTYWVALSYSISRKNTDFLGAILLKWMKEKKIKLNKRTVNGVFKEKEETIVDLSLSPTFDNTLEQELFNMLYEASLDGMLESKEFERWCSKHYSKILAWFDKVADDENKKLINEGKITVSEKKTLKIFTSKIYTVDSTMLNDAIKLKGFKNFLEEFSRIDDKEAIEVNMWEYYLIYAQILGIADKVAKQFKKLYPEIIENNDYGYTYSDFMFINAISYSGINSAVSSKTKAENYSSGGGGFSSGGGGGGSFGGGGGGGCFR